jgi:hypothetical protein
VEISGCLVAAIFAIAGIWLGLKRTRNRETIVVKEVPVEVPVPVPVMAGTPFVVNKSRLEELGITPRDNAAMTSPNRFRPDSWSAWFLLERSAKSERKTPGFP